MGLPAGIPLPLVDGNGTTQSPQPSIYRRTLPRMWQDIKSQQELSLHMKVRHMLAYKRLML